jgi:hypothetical protein
MNRKESLKYTIPLVLVIIIVTSLILLGMASQNPDGFEWALFDFAGLTEPEGGFAGIWAFLGEGVFVNAFVGIVGIIAVLIIGYGFFRLTSRKTE